MSTVGRQTIDKINIDFSRKQKWNLLLIFGNKCENFQEDCP